MVTDAIAGAYAIQKSKLPLRMVDQPLSSIQKGFAFKKGKPNLVKAVNKALADMRRQACASPMTRMRPCARWRGLALTKISTS